MNKDSDYKLLPAIISLTAGLVISIVTIVNKVFAVKSLILIFVFLLGFYVLGTIFRYILLALRTKQKENEEEAEGEEKEDIQTNSDEE